MSSDDEVQRQLEIMAESLRQLRSDVDGRLSSIDSRIQELGRSAGPGDYQALYSYSRNIWSLLRPMDVVDGTMIRVGGDFDGGYIMLDRGLENATAYSFGIGDEVSWDYALAERGTEVYQYDHTIGSFPLAHRNFKSFHCGISPTKSEDKNFKTLEEAIVEHGNHKRRDLILKLDVEGSEWKTIESAPRVILEAFAHIIVEFHGFTNMSNIANWNRRLKVLKKLNEVHQCIHVHANNWHNPVMIGGVMMPDLIEVTYVRREDHSFKICDRIFPTEIDQPGSPFKSDIFLGALGRL